MSDYVRALVISLVSLTTFAVNIPIICVTFRSRRFEHDSVAKLIASLAVSDIGNGIKASCCGSLAWSLEPGQQAPTWLVRFINSAMFGFGVCSIWHLAAVSVIKCTVIVLPLTHFTIFTDRVLCLVVTAIWTSSLVVGCATNVGVTDVYFSRVTMLAYAKHRHRFMAAFALINFVAPTLIIMLAYTKVFLAVRRQVRSLPIATIGRFGSRTIFGSSVRSAKNLFVMCAAHWLTFLPVTFSVVLRATSMTLPDAVQFAVSWTYVSSSAVNGILYIALHSSVRRELSRCLPRCRRSPVVVTASLQPVGDDTQHQEAPVSVMKSFRDHVTRRSDR